MPASGASTSLSSILMWNVSIISRTLGRFRLANQTGRLGDRVVKADLAVIDRLEGDRRPLLDGILAHFSNRLPNPGLADLAIRFIAQPSLQRAEHDHGVPSRRQIDERFQKFDRSTSNRFVGRA